MKAIRIALLASMFAMLACSLGGTSEETEEPAATAPPEPISAPATEAPATEPPTAELPPTIEPAGPSDLELETLALVQSMADEGYLLSTDGEFAPVEDFNETWAQMNWYQWWNTGYAPKDFMVSAHTKWVSASDTAEWWNSGCGFVFRERGEDEHFLAYLGMDGWVYLSKVMKGKWMGLGYKSYGKVDVPEGEADVVMILQGKQFHYFVNGERVLSRNDLQDIGGNLGLTLLSGTNAGFGTRCEMTDVALWILD